MKYHRPQNSFRQILSEELISVEHAGREPKRSSSGDTSKVLFSDIDAQLIPKFGGQERIPEAGVWPICLQGNGHNKGRSWDRGDSGEMTYRNPWHVNHYATRSLLTQTQKMWERYLAADIQIAVMVYLFPHIHFGFCKGRQASEPIAVMVNVRQLADFWKGSYAVTRIDLSKAFDQVSYTWVSRGWGFTEVCSRQRKRDDLS